jgi:TP901 family phage tail tape measure protein
VANQVFVDIVFRKDKKSDLIKKTEKEAGKAGTKAGQKFGKGFNKSVKTQVSGVNNLFSEMRKNIVNLAGGFLVFRGITSSISGAFNSMREFSRSIAEVNSILPKNTKLTQDSIATFTRFAGQFGTSSQGQAKAFYSIVSAGVKGTVKQLNTLKVANQAAVAGLVDINTASRSLVSSVNAYAKSGLTAQEASDSLFVAVREGQTTFGELADFLGNTSAIASSAGVSFNELTGTVSALTKGGIETSKATIALRGVLTSLIKPSDDAKKAAKTLGLEFGVSAVKAKGLVGFLKDVADKTQGSTVALGKLFGNVRGLSGVLKLINGDFADFKRIVEETEKSTGATNEAFKEIKKSTDFKITQLTSEIKAFGDQLLLTAQGPMVTFLTGAKQILKAVTFDRREKTVLDEAAEKLRELTPEINKVKGQLAKLYSFDQGSELAKANKPLVDSLEKRLGLLQKNRAKLKKIIVAFNSKEVETEKEKQEELKQERIRASKEELAARNAAGVNAILKAQELGVLSNEQVKQQHMTKMQILQEGFAAESEIRAENEETLLARRQEFFERSAQIEAAADAQRTAIEDASTNKALGDMALRATGMENFFKRVGISGSQTGKILKQGFFSAMDRGFKGIGAAIAKGENAFDAFVGGVKSALGDVASAFGDLMIKKGLAVSLSPVLGGPAVGGPMIAAGAGLKILAGFLGASSGGAAAGGAGGGGGAFTSSADTLEADIAEPEIQASGPRVALTIEGNNFETQEFRTSLVEFLSESFSEDGTTLDNASFA